MDEIPTIRTNRLLLRPHTLADAGVLQELAGERAIAETYSEIPHPFEDGMAEGWIASHQEMFDRGERMILAITLKPTHEFIGGIGLELSPLHLSAEVGYWIGRAYWNRGYATEAARAIVEYAFGTMDLHRIQSRHMTKNLASGRVLQKIGMTYEGTLRQSLYRFGAFEDAAIYGILQDEF